MPESFMKPKLKRETGSKTTTINTYVDIASFGIRGLKSKTFLLSAVTNTLHFKLDLSMDGTNWFTRLTDISVAVGAPVIREDISNAELRGHWTHARVQVKPAVSNVHGTGTFVFEGSSL